jgi:hypothetical protein
VNFRLGAVAARAPSRPPSLPPSLPPSSSTTVAPAPPQNEKERADAIEQTVTTTKFRVIVAKETLLHRVAGMVARRETPVFQQAYMKGRCRR